MKSLKALAKKSVVFFVFGLSCFFLGKYVERQKSPESLYVAETLTSEEINLKNDTEKMAAESSEQNSVLKKTERIFKASGETVEVITESSFSSKENRLLFERQMIDLADISSRHHVAVKQLNRARGLRLFGGGGLDSHYSFKSLAGFVGTNFGAMATTDSKKDHALFLVIVGEL